MNDGFIKLHRKMTEWDWYTEPIVLMVFIHCIYRANYKDQSFKGKLIKRGSFVTSLGNFSDELNISRQNLKTALRKLKLTNELTTETNNQYTVIHVVNYCKYQDVTNELTNDKPTVNQRLTTIKERKKEKNFIAPTKIEIYKYFSDKGFKEEAEKFYYHYESNGWKVGKNKMKDWQKSASGWIARNKPSKKQSELRL